MPKRRESLESVKTRLVREQRIRTERRVRDLLRQSETPQHSETFEDSDEDNRISQTVRARRDQATQTDRSSPSFCCGVIVGVVVVVFLLVCLIVSTKNDRQRLEE
jgi:hypothetical protein